MGVLASGREIWKGVREGERGREDSGGIPGREGMVEVRGGLGIGGGKGLQHGVSGSIPLV